MEACDCPQCRNSQREQHRFDEQPQEANVVSTVSRQHFPQDQRPNDPHLNLERPAQNAVRKPGVHRQSWCSRMPASNIEMIP